MVASGVASVSLSNVYLQKHAQVAAALVECMACPQHTQHFITLEMDMSSKALCKQDDCYDVWLPCFWLTLPAPCSVET